MYHGQKLQMPNDAVRTSNPVKQISKRQFAIRQFSIPTVWGTQVSGIQCACHASASYMVPERGPFGEPRGQPKQRYQPGRVANGNSAQNNQTPRVASGNPTTARASQNLGPRLPSLPTAALPLPVMPSTRIPNASWFRRGKPNACICSASSSSAPDRSIASRIIPMPIDWSPKLTK